MRLLLVLVFVLCARCGFCQSTTRENLVQDFHHSMKSPYLSSWFCNDSLSLIKRDTITFHNRPNYPFIAHSELNQCTFTVWEFTSKSSVSESKYFYCKGHGYFTIKSDGSSNYRILKNKNSRVQIKLIDFRNKVSWFSAYRLLEYDSVSKTDYSALKLVRLKK
ncbi:hypothetical protein [Hymenobacter agri]